MIKKRVNATLHRGGGVRLSDLGQGKRLWLSLILSFLCAALLCCAFLLPKISNNKNITADAYAVKSQMTYALTEIKQKYASESNSAQALTTQTAAVYTPSATSNTTTTSRGSVTKNTSADDKIILTLTKSSNKGSVLLYTAFNASIEVPAYTEYTVTFTMSATISNTSSTAGLAYNFLYYGEEDHTSEVTLTYYTTSHRSQWSVGATTEVKSATLNAVSRTETFTNATNEPDTKTIYFGFMGVSGRNTSTAFGFTDTVTVTDTVIATDTKANVSIGSEGPDLSIETIYDKSGKTFNFDYDSAVSKLSSVTYTDTYGTTADKSDDVSIEADGDCTLYDAGTYVFSFDLKDLTSIYVWDDTGTKETHTVTVTITPKPMSVNWSTDKATTDSGSYYILPTLNVDPWVSGLLTGVRYYKSAGFEYDSTGFTVTNGEEVSLADIQADGKYYAVTELTGGVKKENYSITGDLFKSFNTDDDRTPVYVDVVKEDITFDNASHGISVNVKMTDGTPLTPGEDINLAYAYYPYSKESGEYSDTALSGDPTDAGKYKVVVSIAPTSDEEYKSASTMEYDFEIKQADPTIDFDYDRDSLFTGSALPALYAGPTSTRGTYTWTDDNTKLLSGERTYKYTFTPESENYKTVVDTVKITATDAGVTKITINESSLAELQEAEIYTSWTVADLKKYITVSYEREDGSKGDNLQGWTIDEQQFQEGENTFTVRYGSASTTFTVSGVIKVRFTGITQNFNQSGTTVYVGSSVNGILSMLTVYGIPNNGDNVKITSGYSLSVNGGAVFTEAGSITVTIKYACTETDCEGDANSDEPEAGYHYSTFTVTVTAVEFKGLNKPVFRPGVHIDEINSKTDLDDLRAYLTVTGYNNDGSDYVDENGNSELTEYELEGKLIDGKTCTVTIIYKGATETFEVDVPEAPEVEILDPIPVPEFEDKTYSGGVIDIVSSWKYAKYVDYRYLDAEGAVVSGPTNAGAYTIALTVKSGYEWESSAKSAAKYSLADDEKSDTITIGWNINKAVLSGKWNSKGELSLSSNGYTGETDVLVKYTYYKDGEEVDPAKLVMGETYTVTAELADTSNFGFDAATAELLAEPHEFTVPAPKAGGITAVWNAMNKKLWVLPLWAWIAIGLAVLILLIIIIVVAATRRKKRETEMKEEKKLEREERMMRMQSMQGMPITAAGMIAAQQAIPTAQQPMPVQQPVQQAMPTAQPAAADSSVLAEIKAELAELKAKINTPTAAADNSVMAMMELKMQMAELKNAQALAEIKTAQAIADDRRTRGGDNSIPAEVVVALFKAIQNGNITPANLNTVPAPAAVAELPQNVEESAAVPNTPTVYPPDAVITTTTTVDTRSERESEKNAKPIRAEKRGRDVSREDSGIPDLDGFYDSYEG